MKGAKYCLHFERNIESSKQILLQEELFVNVFCVLQHRWNSSALQQKMGDLPICHSCSVTPTHRTSSCLYNHGGFNSPTGTENEK